MKSQFSEDDVRRHLNPYHDRIIRTIHQGYSQWLSVKRFMAINGHGTVLYPRTVQNFVFDAVVREAIAEFDGDPDIRILQESQTVKFCFGDVVLARFKKGDEDNLGQNQPTNSVLNFVYAENTLPGLPAAAAKVEFLYSANDVEDGIENVIVAARDGENLLWHYQIDESNDQGGVVPLPTPVLPQFGGAGGESIVVPFPSPESMSGDGLDDEPIVVLRKREDDDTDTEGN